MTSAWQRDLAVTDLEQLRTQAATRFHESQRLARMAVSEAYEAGKLLARVRSLTPHGQWRPWLKAEGISKSSADRYIRLSSLEISQIGTFATVSEALQALATRKKEPPQHEAQGPITTDPGDVDPVEAAPEAQVASELDPAPEEPLQPMPNIYLGETVPESFSNNGAVTNSDQPPIADGEGSEPPPAESTDEELLDEAVVGVRARLRHEVAQGFRAVGDSLDELADRIDGTQEDSRR